MRVLASTACFQPTQFSTLEAFFAMSFERVNPATPVNFVLSKGNFKTHSVGQNAIFHFLWFQILNSDNWS